MQFLINDGGENLVELAGSALLEWMLEEDAFLVAHGHPRESDTDPPDRGLRPNRCAALDRYLLTALLRSAARFEEFCARWLLRTPNGLSGFAQFAAGVCRSSFRGAGGSRRIADYLVRTPSPHMLGGAKGRRHPSEAGEPGCAMSRRRSEKVSDTIRRFITTRK